MDLKEVLLTGGKGSLRRSLVERRSRKGNRGMSLNKLRAYSKIFARARYRRVPDLLRLLGKRPAILAAVGTFETALLVSNRVDSRPKYLAQLKAASLVGCPF